MTIIFFEWNCTLWHSAAEPRGVRTFTSEESWELSHKGTKSSWNRFLLIMFWSNFSFSTWICNLLGEWTGDGLRLFNGISLKACKYCRGATGAARVPKPDKTPIMVACRPYRRLVLFFKIKVGPRSCRSYLLWRPWIDVPGCQIIVSSRECLASLLWRP